VTRGRSHLLGRSKSGGDIVPGSLRSAGVEVRTYAELHPSDSKVPDHEWIPEVAERGWVILTKDKRIRRLPIRN